MDDDPRLARFPGDLADNFPTVRALFAINGLLDIRGLMNLCNGFRLRLVDYQIIEPRTCFLLRTARLSVGGLHARSWVIPLLGKLELLVQPTTGGRIASGSASDFLMDEPENLFGSRFRLLPARRGHLSAIRNALGPRSRVPSPLSCIL